MDSNVFFKFLAILVLAFSHVSKAYIQCHPGDLNITPSLNNIGLMNCVIENMEEEPKINRRFSVFGDGRELEVCSFKMLTKCGNSIGCNELNGEIRMSNYVSEYKDGQQSDTSPLANTLTFHLQESPICSMLFRKIDLSIYAACKWNFMQGDLSVSLVTKNKTVIETVFHQENKMNSSFSNKVFGENQVFAGFTLHELSSGIVPVTCSISGESNGGSCLFPLMLKIRDGERFLCKRQGTDKIDVMLIETNHRLIIKMNPNRPNFIYRDSTYFMICGKETDGLIKVKRLAKVELNHESNCNTANIREESHEITFTTSSGCPQNNANATPGPLVTANKTEDGSTNLNSHMNFMEKQPRQATSIPTPTKETKSSKDSSMFNGVFISNILIAPILICSAFTCLYLLICFKKYKNGNVSMPLDIGNRLHLDTARSSNTADEPTSEFHQTSRVGGILKTYNHGPALPPRDSLKSQNNRNASIVPSLKMHTDTNRHTDTSSNCEKPDRMFGDGSVVKRNLRGTMERCQQDNLRNLQTPNETIYYTVDERDIDHPRLAGKIKSPLGPSDEVAINVLSGCNEFTSRRIKGEDILSGGGAGFNNSSFILEAGQHCCVYAKPKKKNPKDTLPISPSMSSPCLSVIGHNNDILSSTSRKHSETSGTQSQSATRLDMLDSKFVKTTGSKSSSEPSLRFNEVINSQNYLTLRPTKLSYSIDILGVDDPPSDRDTSNYDNVNHSGRKAIGGMHSEEKFS